MKGSVGQALRDARLGKKLTVEEVSRATKIRPERVTDLENDDYTKFPNIAYARNFLVLYAKFLGVDISRYPTVEIGNTIGLGDYQYLRNEEGETPTRRSRIPVPAGPPEKPRWLIAFFIFLVMLALGALLGWGYMTLRRLGPVETIPSQNTAVPTATATPTPTPSATPSPSPLATPVAVAEPVAAAQPVNAPQAFASEIRRTESVISGTPPAETVVPAELADPPAIPTEAAEREITVRATKKVKIRIVRDNPQSPSLYLGSINPAMPPRVYKGKQFWIKTPDPDALKITLDGKPVTPGSDSVIEIIRTPGL